MTGHRNQDTTESCRPCCCLPSGTSWRCRHIRMICLDIHVFGVSVGRVVMGCHAKILTRALKGEYEYQSHAPAKLTWRSLESLIRWKFGHPKHIEKCTVLCFFVQIISMSKKIHISKLPLALLRSRALGVVSYPGSCNMSNIAHGFTVTLHYTFQELGVPAAAMSNNDLQLSHKFGETR